MNDKNVLIVEDRPALRGLLQSGLEKRGFLVSSAVDENDAAERSRELGANLDVVLLDVELGAGGNGLDFGMRLREEWIQKGRSLPEFLIFSAHDKPNYYQTAIRLGAAAYLQKGKLGGDPCDPVTPRPVSIDHISHHVKALALRRALRSDRPGMAEQIQAIARTSQSLEDALERFCSDLLSVELKEAFGNNYILLIAGSRGRICFTETPLALDAPELLERIQAAVHGRIGEVGPLVLEAGDPSWVRDLSTEEYKQARRSLSQLNCTAFVPLGAAKACRLTLGLIPDNSSTAESTVDLARILGRYLNPTVITHWLELTGLWAAMDMERRTLLRATSDFCLYQGQELESLLQQAEEEGREKGMVRLGKLHSVAQDLRGAGEMLAQVDSLANETTTEARSQRLEMAELLKSQWAVIHSLHFRLPMTLQIEEKCSAEAPRVEVEKLVSQVLYWLGWRLTRLPRKEEEPLALYCRLDDDGGRAYVLFEEHASRRMPKRLRDSLFTPFISLPAPKEDSLGADEALKGRRLGLFLARILAETVGGSLVEDSDAIPGDFGHRFVLQLPAR